MTGENGANLFGAGEGLVKHHAGTAGVGEDGVDASVLEGLDEKVTAHGRRREFTLTCRDLLGGGLTFHFAHKEIISDTRLIF